MLILASLGHQESLISFLIALTLFADLCSVVKTLFDERKIELEMHNKNL